MNNITSENTCILIPARSGSQRIEDKNVRNFGGSCLLEIKLLQAKRVAPHLPVILNTNSESYIRSYGHLADVCVQRPEMYATSNVPMNDVYRYIASTLNE